MEMSLVIPSCKGRKGLRARSLTRKLRTLDGIREASGRASVRNDCIVPAAYSFAPGLGDVACRR
ncbi:hypothetical protein GCM10010222_74450 [Streptomyces tanashiensis]|nr:hypothetical protein GCM10010222_74450 [Streptomyces tanashiensis]